MADQICYSVLCVFSYVAAGQEGQKKPLPFGPNSAGGGAASPKQHQTEPAPPSPKVQQSHLPQQPVSKLQTVVGKPITVTTTSPPRTTPTPTTPTITTVTVKPQPPARPAEPPKPKIPPRVQSQGSVQQRGPPPAIPPRAGPMRADSVQVSSSSGSAMRQLKRQISATSVAPVVTPQTPPAFVIPPQRQNSKGSLSRQGSTVGSPTQRKN